MKTKHAFTTLALIASGCGSQQSKPHDQESTINNSNQVTETKSSPQQQKENWQRLVIHEFKDGKGTVFSQMPFPQSWQLNTNRGKGEPTFTGPNGLRVVDYANKSFMYTFDQHMQQMYYQSGQQLRAMPGIEQVIQQDLVPTCAAQGLQFVSYKEIPEVTQTDKWYRDQLYNAVPSRSEYAAIGTEWKSADGEPYFLLMHFSISTTAEMQNWGYWCTGLEADKTYFELAKKQLLFGLANAYYPLEPIMAFNQREAEKAGQSWAAHNQRMAQNQANFEASQRAHVNRTNAINDAIMSGWQQRNAASDKQQEQFLDVINERTNVVDASTGQKYKVSSGSNQYWMNSNGEYIGTQHHDYNPNLDDNLNNQKWQELQEVK